MPLAVTASLDDELPAAVTAAGFEVLELREAAGDGPKPVSIAMPPLGGLVAAKAVKSGLNGAIP